MARKMSIIARFDTREVVARLPSRQAATSAAMMAAWARGWRLITRHTGRICGTATAALTANLPPDAHGLGTHSKICVAYLAKAHGGAHQVWDVKRAHGPEDSPVLWSRPPG